MFQKLGRLRREWQDPDLIALASHTYLELGQQNILAVQGEDFSGAEALQQHQANDGQITGGAEAGPKVGHLIDGQRHHDTLGLVYAELAEGGTRAAEAQR